LLDQRLIRCHLARSSQEIAFPYREEARSAQNGLRGDDAENADMQSAPPEHPDTSPTAPSTQRDSDQAKYTERDHDNMKPQDRFSYIDAKGRSHFMADSISAGRVSQSDLCRR